MSEISIDCDFNSVRYVLAAVRRQLASASIENPLLDAEWIVSHVLGVGRMKLPLLYARELTTVEGPTQVSLRASTEETRCSLRRPQRGPPGNRFG